MIDSIRYRNLLPALLGLLLILSGCSTAAGSAPTPIAPPAATQARPTATAARPPPPTAELVATAAPPTEAAAPTAAPPAEPLFSYPIGMPGRPPGDGFFIRHGVASENTWYNPGYWHTGEDWYAIEGDTAGAHVYAIAAGTVVYAGANYPGRVVIVRHSGDLFSMYGHLDPALNVRAGQRLARGERIGTVLRRGDATPNHLHFEIRTFLSKREVNGDAPRYGFRCGANCPPGPGYWPIDAPDLPSDLGWRTPVHVIAHRMLPAGAAGEVLVASKPASPTLALWSAPPGAGGRQHLGELPLQPGARYQLLSLYAGADDTHDTSALAYVLWYQLALPGGRAGWVQAAVPSAFDTGSDRRPSSVSFNFIPAVTAGV